MSDTHGERTKAAILAKGLELMRADPATVSARRIGSLLDMTHSAVLYHYGTSAALKDAIAAEALRMRDAGVIVYLIATKHPAIATMPDADRLRYMRAA